MMCPKSLLSWTTRLRLPRRLPLPRTSLPLLELLLTLKRPLIPRRSAPVRVRPVTVATSSVVVPLSSTSLTMASNRPSGIFQESSFAASTASTFSSSPLEDTWADSASGLRVPLMHLTRFTVLRVNPSPRTSWPTLTWLVSSTPMRSSPCSTLRSAPTRSTCVKRTLLPVSRLLPSSILMPPPLVRVSSVPRLPARVTRLPLSPRSVLLPRARGSTRPRVRLSTSRFPSREMSVPMDSMLVFKHQPCLVK
mmetsp:Transcript_18424/g.39847  ORF Transcript_18424/g.39847 Transcript_18424/m.39847 type:complete len:250 (+) Transcript_18424:537-1286(+)